MSSKTNVIETLVNDDILSKSDASSLAHLMSHVVEERFNAGDKIYQTGALAENFYLLLSGQVTLITPQGREFDLMHGRFGEETASDSEYYLTSAIAKSAVTVLSIPREAMMALVASSPMLKTDFLFSLTSHLSGEKLERHEKVVPVVETTKRDSIHILGWLSTLIAPILVLKFGHNLALEHNAVMFLAIFSSTIAMWMFNLVDDYIPGIFALTAAFITGLVPAPVILSGFASDGFLMALSTLALGAVVVSSGLSYRLMLNLLMRLPNTQFWQFVGLFMTGTVLTPIIPTANGRVALVTPFFADMVESLHFKKQGVAATRLAIACFGGISLFSAMILTSKSVNYAIYGLLSPQDQDHFQWMTWLMASIVAAVVLIAINGLGVMFLFRSKELPVLPKERVADQLALLGKLNSREWSAIAGVLFMFFGIVTSSIHKVSPPWLGFAMMFGLLLCGTLHKKELKEKVDWTFLLYLCGITGIIAAFSYLGLDNILGTMLPGLGDYMRQNFKLFILILFFVISVLRLAVPLNATIVILGALLMPLAAASGINAWVMGFIILIFCDGWFFPYQCTYYLQLQEVNRETPLYNEKSFLLFNALLNFARLLAVYASLPYWKILGLL